MIDKTTEKASVFNSHKLIKSWLALGPMFILFWASVANCSEPKSFWFIMETDIYPQSLLASTNQRSLFPSRTEAECETRLLNELTDGHNLTSVNGHKFVVWSDERRQRYIECVEVKIPNAYLGGS